MAVTGRYTAGLAPPPSTENTGLAAGLLLSTLAGAVAAPALQLGAVGLIDAVTTTLHNRHHR